MKTPDNIAMMQISGLGNRIFGRFNQSAGVTMKSLNWQRFLVESEIILTKDCQTLCNSILG